MPGRFQREFILFGCMVLLFVLVCPYTPSPNATGQVKPIVVLPPTRKHEETEWKLVTALLGFEPTFRDGVWVWDVRHLVP